ncbi:MAG: acyl-CoA synthetase FdrA [Candidatus Aminicenantes bacterium]|nr:acyl-CoA synthetase FdrA [Candidatus Aminicenantes bacterium]
MQIKGLIKKGEYFDSISLMIATQKIKQMEGVVDAAIMMGVPENKVILKSSGFLIDLFLDAEDSDLLVAVKAADEAMTQEILRKIADLLKDTGKKENRGVEFTPRGLEGALAALPGANLALVSVAGKYAAHEAMAALKKGLHVMIFSDNVPLDKEIELKKYARQKGLLVMGPDCGTAIINGVPLAFANVVNRGNIGIVAASGTGLQEVACLISNNGGGISQAIGTGGRDVKQEVGGITFLSALEMLAQDDQTKVILLVSKPPHPEVLARIGQKVKGFSKPVVAVFLGAAAPEVEVYGITAAPDLAAGAEKALALAGIHMDKRANEMDLSAVAQNIAAKLHPTQKYLRALFTGGTFCSETQVILKGLPGLFSNTPIAGAQPPVDVWKSQQHTVIDLGEDTFTVGKPHPMIDFSTRNLRILQEARDPETAVILLDLVLGYGANLNPLAELLPVLVEAKALACTQYKHRELPVICSVTGTDADPQNRGLVVKALREAGCIVCASNAQAAKLCQKVIP